MIGFEPISQICVNLCSSVANPTSLKLAKLAAPDFDLEKTLGSGQVFHWEKSGRGFVGTIGERPIYVQQRNDVLQFAGASAKDDEEVIVARYFALDHPLSEICASFPQDETMRAACDFCRGLRIIRQPQWECLATFICSSMKQVAHIRQISHKLRERFSEARKIGTNTVRTFPTAKRLARSSESELRACGLGYRAKNLRLAADRVASGHADLTAWQTLPDEILRQRLCELPGVGAKVANCVMLFAYERLEAFPIDVWIARVLKERYFPRKRRLTDKQMRNFSQEYFGRHGGYAQQYLFHHARKTTPRQRGKKGGTARAASKIGAKA